MTNPTSSKKLTVPARRIKLPDGRRRRLVREGARLQSFPDWFEFKGNEESQCNQIGNAVPPILAKALACCVKAYLDGTQQTRSEEALLLSQPMMQVNSDRSLSNAHQFRKIIGKTGKRSRYIAPEES